MSEFRQKFIRWYFVGNLFVGISSEICPSEMRQKSDEIQTFFFRRDRTNEIHQKWLISTKSSVGNKLFSCSDKRISQDKTSPQKDIAY